MTMQWALWRSSPISIYPKTWYNVCPISIMIGHWNDAIITAKSLLSIADVASVVPNNVRLGACGWRFRFSATSCNRNCTCASFLVRLPETVESELYLTQQECRKWSFVLIESYENYWWNYVTHYRLHATHLNRSISRIDTTELIICLFAWCSF